MAPTSNQTNRKTIGALFALLLLLAVLPGAEAGKGGGNKPACNDGQDNDNDGTADYPADPGCSSASDNDEYNAPPPPPPAPECSDGVDNDADGWVDWPLDADCSSSTDSSEGHAPCISVAGTPCLEDCPTAGISGEPVPIPCWALEDLGLCEWSTWPRDDCDPVCDNLSGCAPALPSGPCAPVVGDDVACGPDGSYCAEENPLCWFWYGDAQCIDVSDQMGCMVRCGSGENLCGTLARRI